MKTTVPKKLKKRDVFVKQTGMTCTRYDRVTQRKTVICSLSVGYITFAVLVYARFYVTSLRSCDW